MSKNPKHHTPQKGCYIFQERFWMRALFEKVSLARVFFAIVVRRPPSVVDTKVVLTYYRKRRRDDGSICDIVNERRDMMTTTSKDAFESNRILFTFERERDQIGTKVSFLPAFASSSASPNRKAPIGAAPFPLPFATIATAPHAATPATASAIVFRDDAPLNKGGGFFSSAVFWVLCNNKGASSAREDEIAPYTFILLTEGGVVTQLLLTLFVCGPAFDDDACFNNTSKARAK